MVYPDDVDELQARLCRHVRKLAEHPRVPGTDHHRWAAAYIDGELQASGFDVERQVLHEANPPGENVLTRLRPADAALPLVIIGAHLDTATGSPGADDNATGIACLLELARWIGPRFHAGAALQLAAYDLEESGMIGSTAHCRDLGRAGVDIRAMIALEMLGCRERHRGSQSAPSWLGRDFDAADFIAVCANESSSWIAGVARTALSAAGLPVECIVAADGAMPWEITGSDHRSFWRERQPAVMITDTSLFRNAHYHRATDTPDTIDYAFLTQVTRGVCLATMALLEHEPAADAYARAGHAVAAPPEL